MPPLYTQSAMRSKSHANFEHRGFSVRGNNGNNYASVSSNLANMGVDRSQPYQKYMPKTTSFQLPRRSSTTSMAHAASMMAGLPTYTSDQSAGSSKPPLPGQSKQFRAAETGRGSILPQSSPQHGYSSDGLQNRKSRSSFDSIREMSQRLRSRKRTSSADIFASSQMESPEVNSWNQTGGGSRQNAFADFSTTSVRKQLVFFNKLHPMRKREWAQILVIAVVFFLVFDSYSKAVSTTDKLEHFQAEESMMMMHLQRIEQQWIKVHENVSKLAAESTGLIQTQNTITTEVKPPEVDSELIRVQTQQLYQMEEELDHELHALQEKLQHVARSSIVRTFGEGPVQATLELEFPDSRFGAERAGITIMLWYDTPHAAWTWIQQIRKGEWDGAVFERGKGLSVDASPLAPSSSSLDFVERSQKGHEAWTVGLTDDGGSLKMFINLQDNSDTRKYDVCVGKIIDGFDALQRLVELTRQDSAAFVTIKQARAGHLARHQSTF